MIIDSTRTRKFKGQKRWLPGRAWDFESLMCPIVFCSKLLGYYPYKYKNEEYVVTKMRLAIAAFVFCVHLGFQIYMLYNANVLNTSETIYGTVSMNFFAFLDGSIPMIMFLTSYARSFMLQKVSKVSRILSPQDFNDMAKFLHTRHILLLVLEMLFVPMYYVNRWDIALVQADAIEYCIEVVTVISASDGLLFHLYCVHVLGVCFKKLNESLERLAESSTNDQTELTEEHESRIQRVMLLRKVKYYEDVHNDISDAVDHLNKSSRYVYIVFMASTFVLVTFETYLFIHEISENDEPSMSTYMFFEFCAYFVNRLIQLVILIWICDTAMVPAADIKITIHDLANKFKDDTVKRELRYFSLQVVHKDNAINTRAFKINRKLLSQILSGICMHIMILYQFSMSSNCTG